MVARAHYLPVGAVPLLTVVLVQLEVMEAPGAGAGAQLLAGISLVLLCLHSAGMVVAALF
jgi:hypothetical protein